MAERTDSSTAPGRIMADGTATDRTATRAPDYARTARRMPWRQLPAEVQDWFGRRLGGAVEHADAAGGGFTNGFAGILGGSGQHLFAKAVPSTDTFIYPAYVREAEVLTALPAGLPVPQLIAAEKLSVAGVPWQLLCSEAIDGHMPGNPWSSGDLDAVHDSLLAVQAGLLGLPAQLSRGSMVESWTDRNIGGLFAGLATSGAVPAHLPGLPARRLRALQELVDLRDEALAGTAVLHNDLRADNVIIRSSDSKAFFCDWNFLSTGPAWADWVALLVYPRHAGIDVGPALERSPLSADANPDHVDSWLAVLGAYMIDRGALPELGTSPQLRTHQRFSARIIIDWLIERRKWEP